MTSWGEFAALAPSLASTGQALLFQGKVGYAFLGTVRRDGGPRMHPICPILAEGELWALIVNMGPKYRDLVRDPRVALHSFPTPAGGEEFYLAGRAHAETDPRVRATVVLASGGSLGGHDFEALFRFEIERVLHTHWDGWGTSQTWPIFTKWPG
jgi:hypothetical protein